MAKTSNRICEITDSRGTGNAGAARLDQHSDNTG